jgi:hypothetical protein
VLEIARRADHRYSSVANGNRGVSQDACVAHLRSFTRSRGAGACDYLRGVDEEEFAQGNSGTREAGRVVPVIARASR